ncbi:hypothetical protein T484DRAFT_3578381 [Baffinella frigidus]|nr:hypothetical protein T484DRAFT_3578381 [Cryptophyta sp. CCMP2293]
MFGRIDGHATRLTLIPNFSPQNLKLTFILFAWIALCGKSQARTNRITHSKSNQKSHQQPKTIQKARSGPWNRQAPWGVGPRPANGSSADEFKSNTSNQTKKTRKARLVDVSVGRDLGARGAFEE